MSASAFEWFLTLNELMTNVFAFILAVVHLSELYSLEMNEQNLLQQHVAKEFKVKKHARLLKILIFRNYLNNGSFLYFTNAILIYFVLI